MPQSAVTPTAVSNPFGPIEEENEEDDEDNCDHVLAEAYSALDQLRDAEDETEYLQALEAWESTMTTEDEEIDYLEAFKCRMDDLEAAAAMGLRASRSEFEECLAERKVVKSLSKAGKPFSDGGTDREVVQSLSNGGTDRELIAPLSKNTVSDEELQRQNEAFCSEFEARQAAQLRAHCAIAGGTRYRVIESLENANPGAPLGQDLDF